jgi:hypothetical protein
MLVPLAFKVETRLLEVDALLNEHGDDLATT